MRKFSISLHGSLGDKRPKESAPSNGSNATRLEDPFLVAGQEILAGAVEPGAWARALVQSGGDEKTARAEYVRLRVEALAKEAEARERETHQLKEAGRLSREAERALQAEFERHRTEEIERIAAETGQSREAAEAMHEFGIQMSNDRFELQTAAGHRYLYDRLEDAVRYARSGRP